jgi:hypothetical protein
MTYRLSDNDLYERDRMRMTHDATGYTEEPPYVATPHTFQDVFAGISKEGFDLLVERQRKYGPENIKTLGMFGVFERMASDKIERVRRGMNGTIKHGVIELDFTDYDDESFEDALFDIANYAHIMIAVKRRLWGLPLDDK